MYCFGHNIVLLFSSKIQLLTYRLRCPHDQKIMLWKLEHNPFISWTSNMRINMYICEFKTVVRFGDSICPWLRWKISFAIPLHSPSQAFSQHLVVKLVWWCYHVFWSSSTTWKCSLINYWLYLALSQSNWLLSNNTMDELAFRVAALHNSHASKAHFQYLSSWDARWSYFNASFITYAMS